MSKTSCYFPIIDSKSTPPHVSAIYEREGRGGDDSILNDIRIAVANLFAEYKEFRIRHNGKKTGKEFLPFPSFVANRNHGDAYLAQSLSNDSLLKFQQFTGI